MEFYDLMVQIVGGSPTIEPFPFWIESSKANTSLLDEGENNVGNGLVGSEANVSNCNCTIHQNQVPKLIDDKCKKMERQLSAA